jgi:hypothetical protein
VNRLYGSRTGKEYTPEEKEELPEQQQWLLTTKPLQGGPSWNAGKHGDSSPQQGVGGAGRGKMVGADNRRVPRVYWSGCRSGTGCSSWGPQIAHYDDQFTNRRGSSPVLFRGPQVPLSELPIRRARALLGQLARISTISGFLW